MVDLDVCVNIYVINCFLYDKNSTVMESVVTTKNRGLVRSVTS